MDGRDRGPQGTALELHARDLPPHGGHQELGASPRERQWQEPIDVGLLLGIRLAVLVADACCRRTGEAAGDEVGLVEGALSYTHGGPAQRFIVAVGGADHVIQSKLIAPS